MLRVVQSTLRSFLRPFATCDIERLLQVGAAQWSLEEVNTTLASAVQRSVENSLSQEVLRTHWIRILQTLAPRLQEMTPEQVVRFCGSMRMAQKQHLALGQSSAAINEALAARLSAQIKSREISTPQLISLFQSLAESKTQSMRLVMYELESRLQNPREVITLPELLPVLQQLSKMHYFVRPFMDSLLDRIGSFTFAKLEPSQEVELLRLLSEIELYYNSPRLTKQVETLVRNVLHRAKEFTETNFLQLLEAQLELRYPRAWVTDSLMETAKNRLPHASEQHVLSLLRVFTDAKTSSSITHLEPEFTNRLLTEAARVVGKGTGEEVKEVLTLVLALGGAIPLRLAKAVTDIVPPADSECVWALAGARVLEAANEDASSLLPHVHRLAQTVPQLSIPQRVSMLSLAYSRRARLSFPELEKVVLDSLAGEVNIDLPAVLKLAESLRRHPNGLLQSRLKFLGARALSHLSESWPVSMPARELLSLSLKLGKDHLPEWRKVLTSQSSHITAGDLEYVLDSTSENEFIDEPVVEALELLEQRMTPNTIFSGLKFLRLYTDSSVALRYFLLLEKVDLERLTRDDFLPLLTRLRRIVRETGLFDEIQKFIARLAAFHSTLSQAPSAIVPRINELEYTVLLLRYSVQLASQSDVADFVIKNLGDSELRTRIMFNACESWPELCRRGIDQQILPLVQQLRPEVNTHTLLMKIENFVSLSKRYESDGFLDAIKSRVRTVPPHLYCKVTALIKNLPPRFVCENGDFVRKLTSFVYFLRTSANYTLQVRHEVKLLRSLAVQRIGTDSFPSSLKRIPLSLGSIRPIDTVRLLEALSYAGRTFEETISSLCYNITIEPEKFIPYTGAVLGALSDANLQSEVLSAKVAESLVFSPLQRFAFSPEETAQVLMFCVRIGMNDNALVKRLLSLQPRRRVNRFSLKRYLLALHFQDKPTPPSLHSEVSEYTALIQHQAWKHFCEDAGNPPKHNFVNGVYLPGWNQGEKKCDWTPTQMALAIYSDNQLLGDYLFYRELCRKIADCELELTPSSTPTS